jgi:phenylpyruvate tautomerase PptA (4-oxalocrotonate tautomerase family)
MWERGYMGMSPKAIPEATAAALVAMPNGSLGRSGWTRSPLAGCRGSRSDEEKPVPLVRIDALAEAIGIHRDDDHVYVAITMRSGRTAAQKQAFYRRIAELAHEYAGTEPRNVFVTVTENEPVGWSFGDGVAQYAVAGVTGSS